MISRPAYRLLSPRMQKVGQAFSKPWQECTSALQHAFVSKPLATFLHLTASGKEKRAHLSWSISELLHFRPNLTFQVRSDPPKCSPYLWQWSGVMGRVRAELGAAPSSPDSAPQPRLSWLCRSFLPSELTCMYALSFPGIYTSLNRKHCKIPSTQGFQIP